MTNLETRLEELRLLAEKQTSRYVSSRYLLHQAIVDAYLWWRDAQSAKNYLPKLYAREGIRFKKGQGNQPNFYPLVRLIWNIDTSTKASTISNWAKSLTALDQTFSDNPERFPEPRADLINYINAQGGLKGLRGEKQLSEKELELEEDTGSVPRKTSPKTQQAPIPTSVITRRKASAQTHTPLASATVNTAVTDDDGYVVLIGRRNSGGDIDILSSTYKDDVISQAFWAARDIDRAKVDPELRLLAESIEPHTLPQKLEPYRQKFFTPAIVEIDTADANGSISASKTHVKQNTQLRIRPDHGDILVSHIVTDAGLVTRIKPHNLTLATQELRLRGTDRFWIETDLLGQQKLDVYHVNTLGGLRKARSDTKAALELPIKSEIDQHERSLYFYEFATDDAFIRWQTDVRDDALAETAWQISAQKQWLKNFDATCIDNWLTHTKGLFNKKQMQRVALIPSSTELTLKHWWDGTAAGYQRDHATLFQNSASATLTAREPVFQCSPKDLAMVFSALPYMPLSSANVEISANAHVMKIAYSTDLAEYETFIPAVTEDGSKDTTAFLAYGAQDA
ncbi:hypothetical protein RAZWK3B_11632 [Roseobacter sp. AzwK-3b]|uniref:hypothetical protein n=1 Tax=Roseobacter sp. AzwK-3b TaxID=351016 RepID=UPI000156A1B2|nr:hypothetical protein [Roseobacter sp. AzwK-3b]EDM69387.1 hypothetical protein RAZWK3B_11632 [Roseobacter sp. AzwK-3b]